MRPDLEMAFWLSVTAYLIFRLMELVTSTAKPAEQGEEER